MRLQDTLNAKNAKIKQLQQDICRRDSIIKRLGLHKGSESAAENFSCEQQQRLQPLRSTPASIRQEGPAQKDCCYNPCRRVPCTFQVHHTVKAYLAPLDCPLPVCLEIKTNTINTAEPSTSAALDLPKAKEHGKLLAPRPNFVQDTEIDKLILGSISRGDRTCIVVSNLAIADEMLMESLRQSQSHGVSSGPKLKVRIACFISRRTTTGTSQEPPVICDITPSRTACQRDMIKLRMLDTGVLDPCNSLQCVLEHGSQDWEDQAALELLHSLATARRRVAVLLLKRGRSPVIPDHWFQLFTLLTFESTSGTHGALGIMTRLRATMLAPGIYGRVGLEERDHGTSQEEQLVDQVNGSFFTQAIHLLGDLREPGVIQSQREGQKADIPSEAMSDGMSRDGDVTRAFLGSVLAGGNSTLERQGMGEGEGELGVIYMNSRSYPCDPGVDYMDDSDGRDNREQCAGLCIQTDGFTGVSRLNMASFDEEQRI